MKIYKLISNSSDLVYVGKTTKELNERMWNHKSDFKTRGTCSSKLIFETGGEVSIELIEETEDDSREAFWINELNTCNSDRLTGRKKDYHKNRYQEKKEHILSQQKEYYEKNKQLIYNKAAQQIVCDNCGELTNRGHISRHKKSKKCQNHSPVH